jgi:hypothetical protein
LAWGNGPRRQGNFLYRLGQAGNGGSHPVPAITFTPASVTFDHRTYSIRGDAFSLFTPTGRTSVGFACGPRQKTLLAAGKPKESRLTNRKGIWYLNLVFDLPNPAPLLGSLALGLDRRCGANPFV